MTDRKFKAIFLVSGIFLRKADSKICTINPHNSIRIVGAIFQKIEILIFFLCDLPLILGVGEKLKRTLDIEFERDRSIGLSSTFGDGHTNRHFSKTLFRLWERCRIEINKKI